MKVGVLDCALAGNIFSIIKAIKKIGYKVEAVNSLEDIDKLIIPGVGAFADGSKAILPFKEQITEFAQHKPVLGICLGMQLLTRKGFEFGEYEGLDLIDGETVKINTHEPLPHLGWNKVEVMRDSKLLKGIENESFYYMHSYEVVNYTDSVALSTYASHKFVSVVEKDNVFGVQFHPEKSREVGLQLFENFLKAD